MPRIARIPPPSTGRRRGAESGLVGARRPRHPVRRREPEPRPAGRSSCSSPSGTAGLPGDRRTPLGRRGTGRRPPCWCAPGRTACASMTREARAAVGAGDERVLEPAVGGVAQLAPRRRRRAPRPAGPAAAGRGWSRLASMAKPLAAGPRGARPRPRSIRASGGASARSAVEELLQGARRALDLDLAPRRRCCAPSPSSRCRTARRCTKGRKPTPCTTPVTRDGARPPPVAQTEAGRRASCRQEVEPRRRAPRRSARRSGRTAGRDSPRAR